MMIIRRLTMIKRSRRRKMKRKNENKLFFKQKAENENTKS